MNLQGKRVAYITLGCKLNFSETSTLRHALEEAGTRTVDADTGADILLVNTCAVTDAAERKARQLIRRLARHCPDALLVVVGCYAKLRADELRAMKGIRIIPVEGEKFRVIDHLLALDERLVTLDDHPFILDDAPDNHPLLPPFYPACSRGDRTRCFLKIQDGCDYHCTYCAIPAARGASRSATISRVLESAREAATRGVKEIILTGVNTGDFGRRAGEPFLHLLRALDDEGAVPRYRVSSIEPNLLTGEIIDFIASSRHFMPHFHLPLQSGSDDVLALMGRRYTRDLFARRVERARSVLPDAFIGVDVIAGSRGETLARFKDSLRFISDLDITRLHVFPYSERAGTRALSIPGSVDIAERRRRASLLIALSTAKLSAFHRRFLGDTRPVLFEEGDPDAPSRGFTDNYIRVSIPRDPSLENNIIPVTLSATNVVTTGD
ncbi:MAG: MiaB/RimO family radical SAM methylthiotransferase [Odoribacteraceae bacterium]|jgi:threonylcarbamoyladenosine tRNA methylthiotransferase MtaB|nr:MiaB/RimO family radical SAM methylthiotransferase [Odoribacteraceae bacterium]